MINNILYILGARLAESIGRPEMSCRGLLRYALIDSVPDLDMSNISQVMTYLNRMTYEDWRQLLESATLRQRLNTIGIRNPDEVIADLKATLVEHQSLLTISVR
jgi:hypothetical protein